MNFSWVGVRVRFVGGGKINPNRAQAGVGKV